MTREDAINHIKYGIIESNYPLPKEIEMEALNMAIKALEQEPVLDKARAEIEKLPNMNEVGVFSSIRMKRMVLQIIDKYKEKQNDKKRN